MKKRMVSILTIFTLIISLMPMLPVSAYDTSGSCGDNLTWSFADGVLSIEGSGRMADYADRPDAPWDRLYRDIKMVSIGPEVEWVDEHTFLYFKYIENITVAEDNPYYESVDGVLFNEEMTELIQYPIGNPETAYAVPEGVTSIADKAFYQAQILTELTLPESLTEIGDEAFFECWYVNKMEIPANVVSIGDNAFWNWLAKSITVSEDNINYSSVDGVLFNKSATELLHYPSGRETTEYTVPDSVVKIADGAFFAAYQLKEIEIPNTVTSIGRDAFGYCWNLESITLPDSVTEIGIGAFYHCDTLTDIKIPEGVESIAYGTFMCCYKLEKVSLPTALRNIGEDAFCECYALSDLVIPEGVETIGAGAFMDCRGLVSVTIPASVKSIGDGAFDKCVVLEKLYYNGNEEEYKNIEIGEDNVFLMNATVYYNDIPEPTPTSTPELCTSPVPDVTPTPTDEPLCTSPGPDMPPTPTPVPDSDATPTPTPSPTPTAVPEGVELTEGYYTYIITNGEAKITDSDQNISGNIEIPYMLGRCPVTAIGEEAFLQRMNIESVTIPYGVKSIGKSAFEGCHGINKITIPDSVENIGSSAFARCSKLDSIKLPSGLTSIEPALLQNCTGLKGVTIPLSVTNIGNNAFFECLGLLDVMYEGDKTAWQKISIGTNNGSLIDTTKFYGTVSNANNIPSVEDYYTYMIVDDAATITAASTNLKGNIEIPSTLAGYPVTSIGYMAFYSNGELTDVTIPDGVTAIGRLAFEGCVELENVILPDGLVSIEDRAFAGCADLISVSIPGSVVTISSRAFANCAALKNVTISEGAEAIGESAFLSCESLEHITIPGTVKSIEKMAFYGCENLKNVYYDGSKAEWDSIKINSGNEPLENAIMHYVPVKEEDYTYNISDGEATITGCSADLSGEVVLPSVLGGCPVTAIGDRAFYPMGEVTSVVVPEGVKYIGNYAFAWSKKLEKVSLPEGLVCIGETAFSNCESLRDITIPDSVESIGNKAFTHCAFTNITLPKSLTAIGEMTFRYCKNLESIIIPAGVTAIGESAFEGCEALADAYYKGSETEWADVNIGLLNDKLMNAQVHYAYEIVVNAVKNDDGIYTIDVTFDAEDPADIVWYVAVYDGEGRLEEITSAALEQNDAITNGMTVNVPDNGIAKAFMWRDMTPLECKILKAE